MRVFDHLDQIIEPFFNAAITIGNFDGVHVGHQALFSRVIEKARAMNGVAAAMTFDPHPLRVLRDSNRPPLITLHEQKVELIEACGLDVLISLPFTREFSATRARDFVEQVLVRHLGVKALVVGPDYSFGRGREGNVDSLGRMAEEMDFELVVVPWVEISDPQGERISSTRIRELVAEGRAGEARRLLGRFYQVRGEVEKGRDRGGKLLGFPTANIRLSDELCPKGGVYAVTVKIGDELHQGVANIGYSPTFDDHEFTVEVHILDFSGDLYGKKIKVNFVKRLRGERKFDGIASLIAQIQKDVEEARGILAFA
ncbi:MAG: bifunctional riboflavin kinase/FAD synthetase [Proteobacteria bacterium]|nr:bifunctional riboflavin kinase/FAD synthetase [Pseudomonadota bacterium]